MAVGHVTLDGKQYMLRQGTLPTEPLANQMAPKVSSGETGYDSSDNWSNLVVKDWQGGVGHTRPQEDSSGFLYAEAETRVPNQVILPSAVGGVALIGSGLQLQLPDHEHAYSYGYSTLTVGSGGFSKVAWRFYAGNSTNLTKISIYALMPTSMSIIARVYNDNGSTTAPGNTQYTSGGNTVGGYPYPRWYSVTVSTYGLLSGTSYWFSIEPFVVSDSFSLICLDHDSAAAGWTAATYNGSAWSSRDDFPIYMTDAFPAASFIGAVQGTSRYTVFVANVGANVKLYQYDNASPTVLTTGSTISSAAATSVLFYGDEIIVANGAGDPIYSVTNTGGAATSLVTEYADLLAKHQGIAYKSINNELFSSSDPGTAGTWTSLGTTSDTPFEIRGMCGLGDTLYVACDDQLWGLFPGDFLVPVGPWGSESSRNGKKMVAFQGALYAIVNDRVWRITPDGAMQDVWVSRDDDLVNARLGRVVDLVATDTGVLALVNPDDTTSTPTVWILQGSEWHHLMTLPPDTVQMMYYERTNNRVWVARATSAVFYINLPETAINPYNDSHLWFNYSGWLEYDWYYGPIVENDKDWESVAVMGDLSASTYVKVYYKKDSDTAWTLLGTCDSDGEELYWTVPRTAGKRLKLGFLLVSTSPATTPRIRAFRLKYMVMVKDWFRYNLSINVSGGLNGSLNQEMLDSDRSPYTATQIKAYLDALATQPTPFVFVDIDGSQYLVKVYSATFQYSLVRWNTQHASKEWEGTYQLTLEAVRSGTYA